jgi:tellurium resistance protein TerD
MINLQKGQTIDLRKSEKGDIYDLSKVTIGLGWDVRQEKRGFFGSLFGSKEAEYDLDAIAFLLDSNGKVANLGRTVSRNGQAMGLFEGDVIFFNSMRHPSGHIWLTGDNRTGAGDGDDEQIIALLDHIDPRYDRILFLVTIYQGRANNQHFSMLDNAFIRAVDGKGKEIARYSLSGDASLSGMCCMEFAEMYRKDGSWKFRAIGNPSHTDSFAEILRNYVY